MTYIVVEVPEGQLVPKKAYGTFSTRDSAVAWIRSNKTPSSQFYEMSLKTVPSAKVATLGDSPFFHWVFPHRKDMRTFCGIEIKEDDFRWIVTPDPKEFTRLCKSCDRANK